MTEFILREVPLAQAAETITHRLQQGGVFLNTQGQDGRPNTMTIGWGGVGYFFNKPMAYVPVRTSRYTFGLLSQSGQFTVSVPLDDMRGALAFAGTHSGRDVNKFEGHGLTAVPALEAAAPIIRECGLHLECRVVAAPVLTEACVAQPMLNRWYPDLDMHTLFFGEVLRCYYTK